MNRPGGGKHETQLRVTCVRATETPVKTFGIRRVCAAVRDAAAQIDKRDATYDATLKELVRDKLMRMTTTAAARVCVHKMRNAVQ